MEIKKKRNTIGQSVERAQRNYPEIVIETDLDRELMQQIEDEFGDVEKAKRMKSSMENSLGKKKSGLGFGEKKKSKKLDGKLLWV